MRSPQHDPRRVAAALLILLVICAGSLVRQAYAQSPKGKAELQQKRSATSATSLTTPPPTLPAGKTSGATRVVAKGSGTTLKDSAAGDGFHRPEPTESFTPQIPGSSRQRPDKVFLEQADSIIKSAVIGDEAERQLVKGNVRFRQMGMWMFCDSAYYFPTLNSMDAFGNVRMEQGDTLFVYADKLYYSGTDRYARLRCGPTEPQVRMINRQVKLTTDSLDYDLASDLGWYECGGRLEDELNVLTSVYGQYSPSTDEAEFFHNVELHGEQNDFHMFTDTLFYNTKTKIARIESPTRIETTEDVIVTSEGFYNTDTGIAELMSRSMILHTDSLNRTTTLEGDSIVYDPTTRISRAYSFRMPGKHPRPMVITDTARKATLIGGFGIYNDSTREALATEYPLLMEYSQQDTLYMRADTIRTWVLELSPAVRVERRGEQLLRQMDTDPSTLPFNAGWTFGAGPDTLRLDLPLLALPEDGRDRRGEFMTPVGPAVPARQTEGDSIWHMAMAYPRARFFRKDLQGVADTIIFTELDSLLRMNRLPVIWSEERQLRGDTVVVHFNDSTADWARIPSKAMMMEHVEEDYFNQLHSDKMLMLFANGTLSRLEAEGSVQTIMLPMEQDSTYNRLVDAESSFLEIDLVDGALDRLKMWPEVTGNVTPLFMVKRSQKLLPKAAWLDAIRPKREWYGEEGSEDVRWDDDLGEISPELEEYFETGTVRGGGGYE
ncbi:hypothetical protein HDR69_04415 [bacterium]|nr:hypothetical protein [bacterium]